MRTLLFALLLAGCASTPEPYGYETVVYIVRHAEAEDDGSRDPALSEDGETRAARLAEVAGAVDAVFVSPLRRTQLTATPSASASGVEPEVVPIGEGGIEAHIEETARRVRAVEAGSIVLVVGHSNTAPAIAAALAGTEADDLAHDDYGTVFVVTLPPGGGVGTLEMHRY